MCHRVTYSVAPIIKMSSRRRVRGVQGGQAYHQQARLILEVQRALVWRPPWRGVLAPLLAEVVLQAKRFVLPSQVAPQGTALQARQTLTPPRRTYHNVSKIRVVFPKRRVPKTGVRYWIFAIRWITMSTTVQSVHCALRWPMGPMLARGQSRVQ